jgi:hypothetical protein
MSNDSESESGYWKIIEPICEAVSFYDSWDILQHDFAKISLKQKNLYSVHWADFEICNGGFMQLFGNSTGMLAPDAVLGYRAISMVDCAEIVHEACLMLGTPYPRERTERLERLNSLITNHPRGNDVFDDFERRYYELRDKEAGGFVVAADRYAISG